jgi:hypothetical protein
MIHGFHRIAVYPLLQETMPPFRSLARHDEG